MPQLQKRKKPAAKQNMSAAPKQLQNALLEQLLAEAGPRGATFMGRHVGQGAPANAEMVARAPASDLPDEEGFGMLGEVAKAVIPLGIWKQMSPQAKALTTEYANRFPVSFERMQANPERLGIKVGMPKDVPPEALAMISPGQGWNGRTTFVGQGAAQRESLFNNPPIDRRDLLPHEFQHYMDRPRIEGTHPIDAEQIGLLLGDVLHENNRSMDSLISAREQLGGGTFSVAGRLRDLVKENPAWFPEWQHARESIRPDSFDMTKPRINSSYSQPMTVNDHFRRSMMDEGFAHTAQAASRQDAPTIIKLLAARLGILPE